MDERGQERAGRPRLGVRAALDGAVGVQEPRDDERVACGGQLDQAAQAVVEQLDVGVQEDRHRRPDVLEAGDVRGAEAGVPGHAHDARAVTLGERRAAVGGARVDDDELRRGGQMALDRAQEDLEVGLGVVQDDEQRRVHAAASARTARSSRAARSHVWARARAPACAASVSRSAGSSRSRPMAAASAA